MNVFWFSFSFVTITKVILINKIIFDELILTMGVMLQFSYQVHLYKQQNFSEPFGSSSK